MPTEAASPARTTPRPFVLAPGETVRAFAEVLADTPRSARAPRKLIVTNRRLVLCRIPFLPMLAVEVALFAGSVAAIGWESGAGKFAFVGLIALGFLRVRVPHRGVMLEIPIRTVETVVRAGDALVLGLGSGATVWLAPPKLLMVVWSPLGSTLFRRAVLEAAAVLGLKPTAIPQWYSSRITG